MLFLSASYLLIYANIAAALRCAAGPLDGRSALQGAGHATAGCAALVGLLLGTEVMGPATWNGPYVETRNWSPAAYFASGLLSMALLVAAKPLQARAERVRGVAALRTGVLWLTAVAGLYVCLAVLDHAYFFRDPAMTRRVRPEAAEAGLECVGDSLLVRLEGDAADYRCPTSVLFGRHYREVFAPWPGYEAGASVRLKQRVDAGR